MDGIPSWVFTPEHSSQNVDTSASNPQQASEGSGRETNPNSESSQTRDQPLVTSIDKDAAVLDQVSVRQIEERIRAQLAPQAVAHVLERRKQASEHDAQIAQMRADPLDFGFIANCDRARLVRRGRHRLTAVGDGNMASMTEPTTGKNNSNTTDNDLPKGWKVSTAASPGVDPEFEHIYTGYKSQFNPITFPDASLDAIEEVAEYGFLGREWTVRVDQRGSLHYTRCSTGVESTRHPALLDEDLILTKLKTLDDRFLSQTPGTRAELWSPWKRVSTPVQVSDFLREVRSGHMRIGAGVLIIENINMEWVECLHQQSSGSVVAIAKHIVQRQALGRPNLFDIGDMAKQFSDRWERYLEQVVRLVTWDAEYDANRCMLNFFKHQLGDQLWQRREYAACTRITICRLMDLYSLVLVDRLDNDAIGSGSTAQEYFAGSMPVYYRHNPRKSMDLLECFKNNKAVCDFGLSSTDAVEDGRLFRYLLTREIWNDNIAFLESELKMLSYEAVNNPKLEDMERLNKCRRLVSNAQPGLNSSYNEILEWLSKPHGDGTDHVDLRSHYSYLSRQFAALDNRALHMKQDFNDTFQLLIGAISILDSKTQKELARDGRIQSHRSTALTALASVYLPLSLATGIFGMNVSEINGGAPKWWAVLIATTVLFALSAPFLIWVFAFNRYEDESNERNSKPRAQGPVQHPSKEDQVEAGLSSNTSGLGKTRFSILRRLQLRSLVKTR